MRPHVAQPHMSCSQRLSIYVMLPIGKVRPSSLLLATCSLQNVHSNFARPTPLPTSPTPLLPSSITHYSQNFSQQTCRTPTKTGKTSHCPSNRSISIVPPLALALLFCSCIVRRGLIVLLRAAWWICWLCAIGLLVGARGARGTTTHCFNDIKICGDFCKRVPSYELRRIMKDVFGKEQKISLYL